MADTLKDVNEGKTTKNVGIPRFFRVQELGLIGFIIVLGGIITIVNPAFISLDNMIALLRSSVFIFVMGCGVTFVLVGGEIDLSIGSVFGFTAVMFAIFLRSGLNIFLAMIISLIIGIIIGFISGQIVVRFRIPALIVTLGMLYIYRGVVYGVTQVKPILVSQEMAETLKIIGYGDIFRIPYLVIIALTIGIISHISLQYTRFGYEVRSIGGNKQAAIVAGINVKRIKVIIFIIAGALSAMAGLLIIFRLTAGKATIGQGYELYVIASVIIGGASIYGGVGTIFGSFLGAILISMIQNGMMMMRVDPYWQSILIGVIMIVAVGVDQFRRRRMLQVG